jgi:hypothetical protein
LVIICSNAFSGVGDTIVLDEEVIGIEATVEFNNCVVRWMPRSSKRRINWSRGSELVIGVFGFIVYRIGYIESMKAYTIL